MLASPTAAAGGGRVNFAELLDLIYRPGEWLSNNYQAPGGTFEPCISAYRTDGLAAADAVARGQDEGKNVYFGVNPIRPGCTGRGKAGDVTRLAAIWCDLDVKPGACRDIDHARQIVTALSELLGTRPSAIVFSGGGLQPYWPIDGGEIRNDAQRQGAAAALKRWGRLAVMVAENLGAKIDRGVYDLPRVLRAVGTYNRKYDPPRLVTCEPDIGSPLSIEELKERLDEAGVDELSGGGGEGVDVKAAVRAWVWGEHGCQYMSSAIAAWATDPIVGGRHPWLMNKAIKLACAHRNSCLTQELYMWGVSTLESRLRGERAADRSDRRERGEFHRTMRDAITKVAAFTDVKVLQELNHLHDDQLAGGTAATGCVSQLSQLSQSLDTRTSESCLTPNQVRQDATAVVLPPGVGVPLTGEYNKTDNSDTDTSPDPLAGVVDGAWLDAEVFPPVEYIVPMLITEGMGILVGPPKAGKSWLVAAFALAVAAGTLALGRIRVNARPVLYLALEDGHRRLQSRFRAILGADAAIPRRLHVAIKATPDEALAMIEAFLQRNADAKPLVILDTLGKVKPPKRSGEDSYQVDYAIGSRLKGLADAVPGSALLVVHHSRKAESGDFVDAVSGTHGIAGAADFIAVLARKRHSSEAALSITGRDIVEAEYALIAENRDGIVWRLDGDDLAAAAAKADERREANNVASMSGLKGQILALVNAASGEVDAKTVAAELNADNKTVGQYLRRLADEGRIAKASYGKYRRLDPRCEVCEKPLTAGQADTHLSCRAAA